MVDRIRVGQRGYALIVSDEGRLIAHGNPDEKPHIADPDQIALGGRARSTRQRWPRAIPPPSYFQNGQEMMPAVAPITSENAPPWTGDGRAADDRRRWPRRTSSRRSCSSSIVLALLGTIVLGYLWGRRSSSASSR